ncbi:unnamed protein product [Urochloa humidicola]
MVLPALHDRRPLPPPAHRPGYCNGDRWVHLSGGNVQIILAGSTVIQVIQQWRPDGTEGSRAEQVGTGIMNSS